MLTEYSFDKPNGSIVRAKWQYDALQKHGFTNISIIDNFSNSSKKPTNCLFHAHQHSGKFLEKKSYISDLHGIAYEEIIINKLQDQGATVKIYDPYFISTSVFGIKTENNLEHALSQVDATILLTAHKEFLEITPSFLKSTMKSPIVIDTRGVFDVFAAKESGLVFRSLGRKF